ncbi:Bacteriophage protein [Mycobacteroides abscessus subsp. abscessus]|nr:Bacteriophage protein [Mycobacteroides abscessus subsp. abscessus]
MAVRYLVVVLMPRVVYGNSFSSNGWPMVNGDECTWVTVPGASVSLQIQNGQPLAILRAFAADFNAYVEPLRDPDSACWTPTNSVSTSNHLSGTACDFNWNDHPFQVSYAGFSSKETATVRELLDFYEQTVFWGQDWQSPKDAMHFQVGYNTYQNPHTADFIARKIRADGFSTFRRSNKPNGGAPILAAATGLSEARSAEILPAVSDGLKASQCTNVNRIAMWLAQVGHESVSFKYTEEIAKGGRYAPYIGRTWIQITWDYNYRAFSEWCFERGLVPTRDYFVVNYRELADLKWAGLGASWYWTEQRPMNALTDAGDSATWKAGSITYRGFEAVTAAINGGTNGLADRRDRYNRALLQGEALLQLLNQEEDDMFTDDDRNLLRQVAGVRRPSLSPLRHLDEGDVNTCAGFAWTADGLTHPQFVAMAAKYGHMDSIRLLGEVAGADPVKYPDRQEDAALAKAILADVYAANPAALQRFVAQNGA